MVSTTGRSCMATHALVMKMFVSGLVCKPVKSEALDRSACSLKSNCSQNGAVHTDKEPAEIGAVEQLGGGAASFRDIGGKQCLLDVGGDPVPPAVPVEA